MELRRYFHLLRRRSVLLLVAVVVGLASGFVVSNRTPKYQAQASIYIGSRQFAAVTNSPDASAAMDRLTQTFAAMIRTNAIATAAIRMTNAPRTPDQVVAEANGVPVPNTNYIGVFVADPDPGVAQELANGMAQSFVAVVQSLEPGTGAGAGSPAVTSVFQRASRPTAPLPMASTKKRAALGAALGLVIGIAAVAMLNYLDVSVKSAGDIERALGVPVLASIPVLTRPLSRQPTDSRTPAATVVRPAE